MGTQMTEANELKNLLAQKAALDKQITEIRAAERNDIIAAIRQQIEDYDLSPADLFQGTIKNLPRSQLKGKIVQPRYRDPVSGRTWSGRGKSPIWIRNQNRDAFLIQPPRQHEG
jgi:DNA-binding protein H-NS